ncbi:MAG: glycosyltransferase family 2 protein [Desulfobulbaceae bacterium]|nr:glycosyltransferase family 2 protein [Desulfobulbaceae bacterium]
MSNNNLPVLHDISIVIPMYNEEESIRLLHQKLTEVLEKTGQLFEIIFIDDGSTDRSVEVVNEIQALDGRVVLLELKTNMGKARGLAEGFKEARGGIVFTMDADLQDDPEEIPNFLRKLDEGFDLVSGWKKKRNDPLEKRLPSKLFNKATSLVSGLKLHDFNCGFKAYRRIILDEIKVYGDLHRYIPVLAHWQGYRVGEIAVHHHARQFGHSKYGFERYLHGLFDLFTVNLLTRFIRNPMYLFGVTGFIFLFSGILILGFLTVLQLTYGSILGRRPLSFLGILLILLGGQLISLGMLAEFLTNIFQKKKFRQVSIKRRLNFDDDRAGTYLSVIIPVHDEEDNINTLYQALIPNLSFLPGKYEIIFIDDGSTDNTFKNIENLCNDDSRVRLIQLRKRFGKASALNAGFQEAQGEIIATLDGDLQDDPAYLQQFITQLEDCDFIVGRRVNVPFPRNLFSTVFNKLVSFVSGTRIDDINCGLKVFRADIVKDLPVYGGLQRFLPILVAKSGYRIRQLDVPHRERAAGTSKYNWTRIPKGIFDLLTVVMLTGYLRRPLHLFGAIGLFFFLFGFLISGGLTILKLLSGTIQEHNTLLLIGVMLLVFGFQWISTGLLGEIIAGLDEEIEVKNIIKMSKN